MNTFLRQILITGLLLGATAVGAAPIVLSKVEAQLRKKQVDDVSYRLELDLPESDRPFIGRTTISFRYHPQRQPLRIDFDQGVIKKLLINGREMPADYDGKVLRIADKDLKAESTNTVEIAYTHAYSKDGHGLYWSRDPIDQKAYTFTHGEAYSANQYFPCFDQPDLKAKFQLTVKAQADWTVVSAVRESKVSAAGDQRIWEFPETPRFSTYLFSLMAGPYRIWEDRTFRIPLRLLARQSQADHVPAEEWLRVTRNGFDYYERFLGTPYPFAKYDQIIVPDLPTSGMENVAAITYTERVLVRGTRSLANDRALAILVLHEMAHMWFGDLVTMTWFEDLWLNESFASYASFLAAAQDPKFAQAWLNFFSYKAYGAYSDQLVTTHPITGDVPDTEAAGTIYDGITYNKGAAFLKQLHFVVGDEAFRKALKSYFQKHAYGNALLRDFIAAMEEATGRDLKSFSQDWLTTAGINTLQAEYHCRDGRITDFILKQGAALAEYPRLREHRTQISLYRFEQGQFQLIKNEEVGYQGEQTAWTAAKGLSCPNLVITNAGDHDYVKTILDDTSRKTAVQHLDQLKDPLQRALIWAAIANQVEEAEVPLQDLVRLVSKHLPGESDPVLIGQIMDKIRLPLLSTLQWTGGNAASQMLTDLKKVIQRRMLAAESSLEIRKQIWSTYLQLLVLTSDQTMLLRMWNGQEPTLANYIQQDERWNLLLSLSAVGFKPALAWSVAEVKKDPSSRGQRNAISVQAAFPDYQHKLELLDEALRDPKKNARDVQATINSLFPSSQSAFRRRFAPEFMGRIDQVVKTQDQKLANDFVYFLSPYGCDAASSSRFDQLVQKNFPSEIQKTLLILRQQNERCARIIDRNDRYRRAKG